MEEVQYRQLLSILSNVFLCRGSKDYRIWKPSISEKSSTKDLYLALEGNLPSRASSSLFSVRIGSSQSGGFLLVGSRHQEASQILV